MIKIGDVRIRVSNIKNYGIRKEEVFFEKVYGRKQKEKLLKKSGFSLKGFMEGFTAIKMPKGESEDDYDYFHNGELVSVSSARASLVKLGEAESIYAYLEKGELYVLPGSGPSEDIKSNIEREESMRFYRDNPQYGTDASDFEVKVIHAEEDGIYEIHGIKISKKEDITTGIEKYLYVTTFQGDNYVFGKDKIDVDEKVEELDKRFS